MPTQTPRDQSDPHARPLPLPRQSTPPFHQHPRRQHPDRPLPMPEMPRPRRPRTLHRAVLGRHHHGSQQDDRAHGTRAHNGSTSYAHRHAGPGEKRPRGVPDPKLVSPHPSDRLLCPAAQRLAARPVLPRTTRRNAGSGRRVAHRLRHRTRTPRVPQPPRRVRPGDRRVPPIPTGPAQ